MRGLFQIAELRDVAFEVIKHHHFPESRKPHKLKVLWWRVGRHLWCMNVKQNIELTKEQWGSLTPYNNTEG